MRLFAGIPVEGEASTVLAGMLERWRQTSWPVRWVRGEGLHFTLKFYGQVESDRVDLLAAELGQAGQGTPVLPIEVQELGGFPSLSRARVLWAGIEAPPALELLVDRIERRSAALGFPLDGRAFRPHITLGRLRDDSRLPAEAIQELEAAVPRSNFLADRFVLYESRPGPGGSAYHPHVTFALGS